MTTPAVWITRPEPGNTSSAAYLRNFGFPVVAVPVLEVSYVKPEVGLEAWPDWVLFVSSNAVRGLGHALLGSGLPETGRSRVRAAAVGTRTALEAGVHGWQVELVPSNESADGLLEVMSRVDMRGRRVWIPAGNREGSARGALSQTLRERGADVQVFTAYETRDRIFTPLDETHLNEAEPGAVVFHSPSALDALCSKAETAAVRGWLGAELVAIGPTTTARAREKGFHRVHETPEPSDPGLVSLLLSLGKWEQAASGNLERKRV